MSANVSYVNFQQTNCLSHNSSNTSGHTKYRLSKTYYRYVNSKCFKKPN